MNMVSSACTSRTLAATSIVASPFSIGLYPEVPTDRSRLPVLKTYKLYIGGKFPRGESGRVSPAMSLNRRTHLANYCMASRKDLRDAVVASRKAQPAWSKTSSYLRAQILYRVAEMAEVRRSELKSELSRGGVGEAEREVSATIDRLIQLAGWTDKFPQLFGSVNPVASPHFNFTFPEATGVVGIICPDSPALLGMISLVACVVLSGNTCLVLASETLPLVALTFAEILSTSDVPGGVINVLTGSRAELAPHFASHMDVNAIIDGSSDSSAGSVLQSGIAQNLKRYANHSLTPKMWFTEDGANPYRILDAVEMKTAWHPIGA